MEAEKDKGRNGGGSRPIRVKNRMCSSSSSIAIQSYSSKAVNSHMTLARSSSNSSEFLPLHTILLQCSDIYQLQDAILEKSISQLRELSEHSQLDRDECEKLFSRLETERLEHSKTKYILSVEQESVQLAMTEMEVLRKQLDREKSTFNEAFGLLKSKALADASKSEDLLAKCTGLETLQARKDETIIRLETQVKDLNQQIKEIKQSHRVELQEANVRMQQDIYLARHFREPEKNIKQTTTRGGFRKKIGTQSPLTT